MENRIETEKKFRLNNKQYEEICSVLQNLGAEFLGESFEENKLFTNEHLRQDRAILRLRKTGEKAVLTYKKRIQNQFDIKHQIEYETIVSDAEAIEKILENSGFVLNLVYEKRRKTWKLRGAEVVLDELPFGFFMEIEGNLTAILEAEALLGAEDYEVEHETYPNLTLKYGKKEGNLVQARF
ncbi:MAG: CYTH domain-containing protein [Acidobacteria bacterium]|jgi:adenylate cyclase class 2|nr:MAG: CYTH domain-containing protein [Acidobacteriota bacterium]GIU81950.1 MAG: hypothetical protein KatS3mg006_1014 [Pyrinomonadaceae bacterium]